MNRLLLAALAAVMVSCVDEQGSRRALESQGFTEIQLIGHTFIGCSDSDDFATKFTAVNAVGRHVLRSRVLRGLEWVHGAVVST